jgi:hypothetical protein
LLQPCVPTLLRIRRFYMLVHPLSVSQVEDRAETNHGVHVGVSNQVTHNTRLPSEHIHVNDYSLYYYLNCAGS